MAIYFDHHVEIIIIYNVKMLGKINYILSEKMNEFLNKLD